MALRFYVIPRVGTGTREEPFIPSYVKELGITEVGAVDYGLEDTYLVGANVTPEQHSALAENLDVVSIPLNLDANVTLTALPRVQEALEGLHVPSDWVTTNHTYRDVIRVVGKLFKFMQWFNGTHARKFFESEVTLDTRVNQLTQAQRNAILNVATAHGIDTSEVTGTMLLRRVLRIIFQQMPSFTLMGETF